MGSKSKPKKEAKKPPKGKMPPFMKGGMKKGSHSCD